LPPGSVSFQNKFRLTIARFSAASGISRRGNRYLRTLFIQGARSVLQRSDGWEKKSFGRWLIAASKRLHKNVLAAALANKLARIAWAVLYNAREYDTALAPKAT
jgi:hypothetical protein